MIPTQLWVFKATLAKVVDGDTLDLTIDAGFHTYHLERVRLLGVNAPELHGASAAEGLAAKEYVTIWAQSRDLVVQTYLSDSFGRFLAEIWRASDGASLNADLLSSGHAVPYVR